MHPLITVGGLTLSSYALVYSVAIMAAGMVALWRMDGLGLPRRKSLPVVGATVVGGLLGSVALWRLMGWIAGLTGRPEVFTREGSTIMGVLLFGLPSAWLALRIVRVPAASALDRGLVAIPLGQAIGRVGCLLAGCCAGRPTGSWLAMNLPDGAGHWCPRYPAQLIASAADLGIFILLLMIERLFRGRLHAGQLAATYFALYGAKRFAMEFIRLNAVVLGPLTWAQLLAGAMVIVAAAAWTMLGRRSTA